MPELPEVEVTAQQLRRAGLSAPIIGVEGKFPCRVFQACSPGSLREDLIGRHIQAIHRQGKYLLLDLDDGATLLLHRGMSGSLRIRDEAASPDRYVRLTLSFADGRALEFNDPRLFGRVVFFPGPADRDRYLAERLGQDALTPVDAARIRSLFGVHRQAVKLLLLDQHLLAGIGNLYADEILWTVQIHPATPGNQISESADERLASAIPSLLEESIRRGGTTSAREHIAAEDVTPLGERLIQVYHRAGRPCPRCQTPIIRIVLGGRGTYLCPKCQPNPAVQHPVPKLAVVSAQPA